MDMRMDGRNPYGSRGGYVRSTRGGGRGRGRGRRDRGMYYDEGDMRMRDYGDMTRRGRYGDYGEDMRRDYEGGDMARGGRGGQGRDRGDYGDYDMTDGRYYEGDMRRGRDGHYMGGQRGYEPIEFMGYCSGYYGAPQQDYGRGDYRRGDYGRYYRSDYGDYGDDYGDYGETLSDEELDRWNKKLMQQLDEREKQMFSKEAIMQKIKQMNIHMEGFGEKELYTATLAMYTDHKSTIGQNVDLAIKLGRDFLTDKDSNVKGAERLAVYYDTFVAE